MVKQSPKPATRLTQDQRFERRKAIADFMRKKRDLAAASQKFGVSGQTVKNACAEHGVPWSALEAHGVKIPSAKQRAS